MNLTNKEHTENAEDWIGSSQDLSQNEKVDRVQLAEQMSYTTADTEDIEEIALEIEHICSERL